MNYLKFSNPIIPFTFNYPDPTPQGVTVVIHERVTPVGRRFHLISEGSEEIYFEVGRYENQTMSELIERFKQELLANNPEVDITDKGPLEFLGSSGMRLVAQWPEKSRVITFFQREGVVCRIIFNPASDLNYEILESVSF